METFNAHNLKETCKRKYDQIDNADYFLASNWPRFLVIEGTNPDAPLSGLSIFAIAKGITGLAGEPKSLKRQQSGNLLVEVTRQSHATNLLRSTKLDTISIKVSPHRSLNQSKGVVSDEELKNVSEEEILQNLKQQGVIAVKKIKRKEGTNFKPTNTHILTFNSSRLPAEIKIGFTIRPVRPFIPNPLRCFKCQRFGHGQDRCKRNKACARCGKDGHDDSDCNDPMRCVNCSGEHKSFSRDCPKWILEKEIQKVKHTSNVSFFDARKMVESSKSPTSYASIVKPITKSVAVQTNSISTQTDNTGENKTLPPKIMLPSKDLVKPNQKPETKTVNSNKNNNKIDQNKVESSKINPKDIIIATSKTGVARKDPAPKSGRGGRSRGSQKGSRDPIKMYNFYGALDDDMDTEEFIPSTPPSPIHYPGAT